MTVPALHSVGTQQQLSVLVAEPDPAVAADLAEGLAVLGADVTTCANGAEALLRTGLTHPDVVLISTDLPGVPVAAAVQAIREQRVAAVIAGMSASDDSILMNALLAAGVSAIVARPYRMPELTPLLAGIRPNPTPGEGLLSTGSLSVDMRSYEATLSGRKVQLTVRELELLAYLIRNTESVVTSGQIMAAVWGRPRSTTNTLVVHIRRLRVKLGDDLRNPRIIRTVRGLGYRLVAPDDIPAGSTSATSPSTRDTTSSRIRRISSIGLPAGSSIAQSR